MILYGFPFLIIFVYLVFLIKGGCENLESDSK